MDTRVAAARVVAAVSAGQSLNQALPPLLPRVKDRDRGLLQQLCYGTLRYQPRLSALLRQLLTKSLKRKDADVQALLLVGLYQLSGESRIPQHAAVAATVDATRGLGKTWAKGLCNAVLRRYLREHEALASKLSVSEQAAHPDWLYEAVTAQWPHPAAQVLDCNNSQPPMTLRVNARHGTRDSYLALLAEQGIPAQPGKLCEQAIYLEQACDVDSLPGFNDGLVSVQDEAAQLAAGLLDAGEGDRVLDACAAPGGKTCHILELQPGLTSATAMDVDNQRLQRVDDNLQRLQLSAELLTADAAKPPTILADQRFHRILVDAPCSATGVVRRHPDVKLLRRPLDIASLQAQQLAILRGLWPLLAAGGKLLYATCSILREENSDVVDTFLSEFDDARALRLDCSWGQAQAHGRQLLPEQGGPDGLYYALLEKSAK